MGTFSVTIEIGDQQGQRFEQIETLVDTGAVTTMVPGSLLRRLGVVPSKSQLFEYAGGEQVELNMGIATVRVDGNETPTWVIFGDEGIGALLGSYTLEGLLLGVDLYAQRLIPVRGPLPLK